MNIYMYVVRFLISFRLTKLYIKYWPFMYCTFSDTLYWIKPFWNLLSKDTNLIKIVFNKSTLFEKI